MLEVARPNVIAEVTRAADVEKTIKELMRGVGNGANINNAGSNVTRVVAAAPFAFSSSVWLTRNALFSARQPAGVITESVSKVTTMPAPPKR